MRTVGVVAFEQAMGLDIAGPAEVFAMANRLEPGPAPDYALEFLSPAGGPVRTLSGLTFDTIALSQRRSGIDTLIVVGGRGPERCRPEDQIVDWIRAVAPDCRRVCSVCTGAFFLAAAGLLDGRRAVTHWESGADFAARFPNVRLDLKPIYVRDGAIWTSAGVTAGIDLALALVEDDLGRDVALAIAKQLVMFLHRPGDQAQFSTVLSAQAQVAGRDMACRFHGLHAWIADHLTEDLSVIALAERVNMSARSFARGYAAVVGETPGRMVEAMRIEAAKQALERGHASIKQIAAACGFGDAERMRRAFLRRLGVSPDAYRSRFAGRNGGAIGSRQAELTG